MSPLSRTRLVGAACCCAVFLMLAGCQSTSVEQGQNPRLPASGSTASLRAGDTLVITLQGVPDPSSNQVQIDDQGLISLPYIGVVKSSGMTTANLSQQIRDTYVSKKIYTAVDVSVSVTERYVYVGGEVGRPGRVIWTSDLTVAKAVQAAGGFSLYARERGVNLVRDGQSYLIDAQLALRKPSEDPLLMPGDALQVPKSAF
ncbi:MAG: polysaccharide export protein [Opitutaceae bacterium]|jgi:polysaccharide export outer membrane protein|nr:polysaccharide export protein [Opitutaceae bacterium]